MPGTGISISPFLRRKSAGGWSTANIALTIDYTATQFNFMFKLPSTKTVTLHWGDGTSEEVVGQDGTLITKTSSYSGAGSYKFWLSGDVTDITYIDVNGQAFVSGDVSGWSALTSLTYLSCYSNSLTGDVSGWSALTSLTTLYCSSNSLTGDVSGWSALTSLTTLNCSSNSLTGDVSGWSALTSLTTLSCSSNSLTGDVSGWSALTSLTYLNCSSNSLDFDSSPAWAALNCGANFNMADNAMTSGQVDNAIISFAQGPFTNTTITLNGTNAARTAASDAAVATLVAAGCTVLTT